MNEEDNTGFPLSRLASALSRLSQRYYDRELEKVGISGGQQFFLLHIYANEGISILDLADSDHFDKGTTARAIHKLERLKYVVRCKDPHDKRISRLFLTDEGKKVIQVLSKVRHQWNQVLMKHLCEEDSAEVARIMEILIHNACAYFEENNER